MQFAGSTTTEAYNFDYDRVYRLDSKEESRRLFLELVQPLLDRFLMGFNVTVPKQHMQLMNNQLCRQISAFQAHRGAINQGLSVQVFAYGQTGSGKTYTMGTAASVKEVSGKAEATGVIPRSIKSIFATMQQARADYDVNMKVCTAAVHFAALAAVAERVQSEHLIQALGRLRLVNCIALTESQPISMRKMD